jgi:hypothetical protein
MPRRVQAGGRKLGSRNRLSEAFISDLHDAWLEHGKDVIEAVIKNKPHEMLRAVASLLPRQFDETVSLNISVLAEIKDFTEAYRYALGVIGSDKAKAPKLIESGNGSDWTLWRSGSELGISSVAPRRCG